MTQSGLTDVLAVREFRVVFGAELFSLAGDQLARVALAVLVYARTGSAAYAAGTYALTFLPALLGGVLLAWTADRMRRREVMVAADLLRAVGIGVMAVPGLPLWVLCSLLVVVVLPGAPHSAAQGALLPEILVGDRYERGLALRTIGGQTAQLIGFAVGGAVVATIGPPLALAVDAVTFVISAVVVRVGLADRPTAAPVPRAGRTDTAVRRVPLSGLTTIAVDPFRRAVVALAWTVGAFVVPEGLAVPYAAQLHDGAAAGVPGADLTDVGTVSGLLMAAGPLGSAVGAWAFTRFVPRRWRERLVGAVAVAVGLPLMLVALRPGVAVTLLLWGLAGAGTSAYLLQAQAMFVRATPVAVRGRAIGVAASGIVAVQGLAVLIGGLLADATNAATAIAVCGAGGSLAALTAAVAVARAAPRSAAPAGDVAAEPS